MTTTEPRGKPKQERQDGAPRPTAHLRDPWRSDAAFAFLRILISLASQRWQKSHPSPMEQPCGL